MNYHLGASVSWNWKDGEAGILSDVLYCRTGGQKEGFIGHPNLTVDLDYITVPVLARIRLKQPIYLIAGLQLYGLIRATDERVVNGRVVTENIRGNFRETDLGAVLGFRSELSSGLAIDLRYALSPVINSLQGENYRLEIFQLSLSYLLEL